MRILHTSDWHLGAQLHEQSRIPEQTAFLEWLKSLMAREKPDVLIVAGDIFDTCAPSNTALNLYYDFLSTVFKEALCRTVVVVGGNHDSPSLLDAPGNVLAHLQTQVVGTVEYQADAAGNDVANYEKEVVVVKDAAGMPGLVIGAIPYLRDADLRSSEAQETDTDRSVKLKRGFREHYAAVANLARAKGPLPLVLSGHLFLTGGTTAEEKSERDLQMGNLGSLGLELLPPADYYALGHLHKPQTVGGNDCCRYSGAPIMMGFGEIGQVKSVALVDFAEGKAPVIRLESVPQTQLLIQLKGTPEDIDRKLTDLVAAGRSAWVDIQVNEGIGDLAPWWNVFSAIAEGSSVRLLRWQNARPGKTGSLLAAAIANEARLEHLTPEELFEMRLKDENLTAGEKDEFTAMFKEILQAVAEADANKE